MEEILSQNDSESELDETVDEVKEGSNDEPKEKEANLLHNIGQTRQVVMKIKKMTGMMISREVKIKA